MKDNIRYVALELALSVSKDGDDLIANGAKILAFLESSKSESSTTKPKRTKAASESAPAAATGSSTSVEATSAASPSASEAPAKASAETGTSQASSEAASEVVIPTIDQVRAELTQYQSRCGGDIAKPRALLTKYAPTGTFGSLKPEDRAKVIAECRAA